MEANSNNLTSWRSATCKSLFCLRWLKIKVFIDHLHKVGLTINRGFFMTLDNAEHSQTLAKQTNAKLNMLQ